MVLTCTYIQVHKIAKTTHRNIEKLQHTQSLSQHSLNAWQLASSTVTVLAVDE